MAETRTTILPLADKTCFEVDVLVPSFHFKPYELIIGNVMYTIYGTGFDSNLNSLIVVSPLIEHSSSAMLVVHEESRLGNHGTVCASNACVLVNINHLLANRFTSLLVLLNFGVRFYFGPIKVFIIRRFSVSLHSLNFVLFQLVTYSDT